MRSTTDALLLSRLGGLRLFTLEQTTMFESAVCGGRVLADNLQIGLAEKVQRRTLACSSSLRKNLKHVRLVQ
jgi:hypothetical protein